MKLLPLLPCIACLVVACAGHSTLAPAIANGSIGTPRALVLPALSDATSWPCAVRIAQNGRTVYQGDGTCGIGSLPHGAYACGIALSQEVRQGGWCLPAYGVLATPTPMVTQFYSPFEGRLSMRTTL